MQNIAICIISHEMHTQSSQLSQPCASLQTCKSEFLPTSIPLSADKCKITATEPNPFSIPGYKKCIHDWSCRELCEYKPGSQPTHPLHPRDHENRCFVLKSTPSAHLSLYISLLLLPPKISNIQCGYFIKTLLCWCTFLSGENSRALGMNSRQSQEIFLGMAEVWEGIGRDGSIWDIPWGASGTQDLSFSHKQSLPHSV